MLNVIINEGLYDKAFVEKWTHGFEELKERVQQYPVEKVSAITEVPAKDIAAAARMFAKPSRPHPVGRADRHVPRRHHRRARDHHLWSITGNIDMPGGQVIARPAFDVTTYPFSTEELLRSTARSSSSA